MNIINIVIIIKYTIVIYMDLSMLKVEGGISVEIFMGRRSEKDI